MISLLSKGRGKALFLLVFCFFMFATMARAEVVERILAVVNDDVITKSEVDQMAKAMQSQPGMQMISGKELEKKLLDAMITQKLAITEAKRRGIAVTDKEVQAAFDEFKKRNNIQDDATLAKALAREGMTIKGLKKQIHDQMLTQSLMNIVAAGKAVVTDKQVHDFYDKEFPKTAGGQIHLKILNMPYPPGATDAQKEEVQKKAEMILQEHRKGVTWEQMRDKYAIMLQDMGYIKESDLDPELAQFLSKVKSGETAPIQTLKGFQLVQVVDRKDSKTISFEQAAPKIRLLLQQHEMEKTFQEWIKAQKDKSHIKIMM
jgi:peptidyl-prolyl cis-trans isomerase SurA